MDNSLTVLWVLALGVAVGVKAREWWESQPTHGRAQAPGQEGEPHRVAQDMCRCQNCQAPFFQESPAEVQ